MRFIEDIGHGHSIARQHSVNKYGCANDRVFAYGYCRRVFVRAFRGLAAVKGIADSSVNIGLAYGQGEFTAVIHGGIRQRRCGGIAQITGVRVLCPLGSGFKVDPFGLPREPSAGHAKLVGAGEESVYHIAVPVRQVDGFPRRADGKRSNVRRCVKNA